MADYSNRTIVALLAVALVVTVVGTVVSVSKLNELGGSFDQWTYLTGAAVDSSTGQTNITITATTSLTLANTTMNFGSGRVNASCDICGMDSNNTVLNYWGNESVTGGGQGDQTARGCCVGFSAVTAGFLIENTGNVNVSVGYTCSGNCTFDKFIGGSFDSQVSQIGGIEFEVNSQLVRQQGGELGLVDATQSCAGGGAYRGFKWNVTNSSVQGESGGLFGANYSAPEGTKVKLSPSGHWLCGNYTHSPLSSFNENDAAVVDMNLSIPQSAPASGVRSSFTLTFNATSQ